MRILLERAKSKIRRDGVRSFARAIPPYLQLSYQKKRKVLGREIYEQTHNLYSIYEEDWDLLIILDGCRYDLLTEVWDEYDFLSDSQARYSPASSSREWLEANFDQQYADSTAETTYVTGNPYTQEVLKDTNFETLDEVWRYAWDDSLGTIPPRPLTDRLIHLCRTQSPKQSIVHYMQPHFPALSNPGLGGQIDRDRKVWVNSVWDKLEEGKIEQSVLWEAYRQNLKDVLDDVVLLLKNVDAEQVVITADHGNGFGENGIYGHPSKEVHDVLRKVPWVRTSAEDLRTHQPAEYNREVNQSVQEKLAALGYVPE